MSDRVRINVFVKGTTAPGKAVIVSSRCTVSEFLSKCAEKIGSPVARAFKDDGKEELLPPTADISTLGVKHDSVIHVELVVKAAEVNPSPAPTAAPAPAPAPAATLSPAPAAVAAVPAKPRLRSESTKDGFSMEATLEVIGAEGKGSAFTLNVQIETPPPKERRTLLVILADQSGSMLPSWHQVQQALLYIAGESFGQESLAVEIILYGTHAKRLVYTRENFEAVIMEERARGSTCFASAFDACREVVAEHARRTPAMDVIIGLMTDGGHTTPRNAFASYTALKDALAALAESSVVVHTIGFTEHHKFETLDRIRRELGKCEGTFQYAEPADGRTALRRKMEGIFDVASLFGGRLVADVALAEFVFCPTAAAAAAAEPRSTTTLPVILDREGRASLSFKVRPAVPSAPVGEDMFCALNVSLKTERGSAVSELACQCTVSVTRGDVAAVLLEMREISDAVDSLFERISTLTAAPPPEISDALNKALSNLQERLKAFEDKRLFALPRAHRSGLLESKTMLHQRVGQMLEIMMHFARGVFSSATKARLADLAFGGSFKTNRQRRVDRRVARNALLLKDDTVRLRELVVHPERLTGASEESRALFSCIMSLADWTELASEKDVCGFGLAVTRPEWTVDDPTQMRVLTISNTCLSKTAMEDCLRSAIDLYGHLKTTGGFGIGTDMGVAVRGRGREPINSWLPLFINAEHWAAASILLKQILGYFVVLDPLAFAVDQVEALLLVLGTMAARLNDGCGEHALKLVLQFQRTCVEIARHFNHFPAMEERLKRFITMSPYETRDQVKNLVAVAAYLLVLPLEVVDRVFPTEQHWVHFWANVMTVAVRRSAFSVFSEASDRTVNGFIDRLLYGKTHARREAPSASAAPAASPSPDPTLGPVEFAKTVSAALPAATAEEEDKFEDCTLEPATAEDELKSDDPHAATAFSAAVVSRFVRQMERRGYPTPNAVHSLLTYVGCWLRMAREHAGRGEKKPLIEVLDDTWGIAPTPMIVSIKQAFAQATAGEPTAVGTIGRFYSQLMSAGKWSPDFMCDLIRATVGMGVRFRVNKPAREAIDAGVFVDPFGDPLRCLLVLHDEQHQQRDIEIRAAKNSLAIVNEAGAAMADEGIHAFIAWVGRVNGPRRFTSHFREVIIMMKRTGKESTSMAIKLCVLITGRYYEKKDGKEKGGGQYDVVRVFDGSHMWLPGKKTRALIGEIHLSKAMMKALCESYFCDHGLLPS